MITTKAYAAQSAKSPLAPFSLQRREAGDYDVHMEILYCGVCHSDIHQVRGEWGNSIFPMVPGHEIVGRVVKVGSKVSRFKVGDLGGVGCFVDSCRNCPSCAKGLEQYCENGMVGTYNSYEKDKITPTYGGYSKSITVDESYTLKVSEKLDLSRVAPLLCAGITTYSPLRHWNIGPRHKVAVVGLGGLGHMGVKFATAFGAKVTVISTSANKEADARKLGAHAFLISKDEEAMKASKCKFDFILDTVSATHDINAYMQLLAVDGTYVQVGLPTEPNIISSFTTIPKRRSFAGSMIGGIAETQEMLDYCAEHNILSDVEVIEMDYINTAYERMLKGDVHYRFVIDLQKY